MNDCRKEEQIMMERRRTSRGEKDGKSKLGKGKWSGEEGMLLTAIDRQQQLREEERKDANVIIVAGYDIVS